MSFESMMFLVVNRIIGWLFKSGMMDLKDESSRSVSVLK
ncbi:hypothetical protein imdm_2369 [gamma proteobacterium IMCC2047]|nr:hypothetical protein imdm_2369 [gamma proteobacterium IMCC2047]